MDERFSIRSATEEDAGKLAALRLNYMHSLFEGYLPDSYLNRINAESASRQVSAWLNNKDCHIGILESSNQFEGYVVCAPDRELDGWGLILESGAQSNVTREQKQELTQWALKNMQSLGMNRVHTWLLQDNLRARFMFESFGFKAQREMKLESHADYTMTFRRYVFDKDKRKPVF